MIRVGSLFSGSGALDLAVHQMLDTETAWFVENDPAACRVLAHHWPDIPRYGDITALDWSGVDPVDVLTGGFPCTDVSSAGRRAGLRPGTRSGLWSHMVYAISQLQPRLVVIENVRGLLSADAHCDLEPCPWCLGDDEGRPLRALGAVLGDLADLGFDARWCGLRASDVGAPHARFRVFIAAWLAADASDVLLAAQWGGMAQGSSGGEWGDERDDRGSGNHCQAAGLGGDGSVADTAGEGGGRDQPQHVGGPPFPPVRPGEAEPGRRDSPAANANSQGRWPGSGVGGRSGETAQRNGAPPVADAESGRAPTRTGRGDAEGQPLGSVIRSGYRAGSGDLAEGVHELGRNASVMDWGTYTAAIRRWELILGRTAPGPTISGQRGGQQLSPRFVEWLMGWPQGWVTEVPGLSRNDQLKICGNGVVIHQAVAALELLLDGLWSREVQ